MDEKVLLINCDYERIDKIMVDKKAVHNLMTIYINDMALSKYVINYIHYLIDKHFSIKYLWRLDAIEEYIKSDSKLAVNLIITMLTSSRPPSYRTREWLSKFTNKTVINEIASYDCPVLSFQTMFICKYPRQKSLVKILIEAVCNTTYYENFLDAFTKYIGTDNRYDIPDKDFKILYKKYNECNEIVYAKKLIDKIDAKYGK